MIALFAAKITLELFTPLLIGSLLALCIFGLGRVVATRKFTRALDEDDGLPEFPGAEPPRAIHHNAALAVNDPGGPDTAAPRLRDIEASGIKCAAEPEEGAPIAIEFQRTREFIRAQSRKVVAAMETEKTTPFARAYLGGEDFVSPQ